MSNNHDIHQYLVEPDFALWLKETGFDGECFKTELEKEIGFTRLPTFAQAFDFVYEKHEIYIALAMGATGTFYFNFHLGARMRFINGEHGFETKREASVAACNAIKQYVNDLQKDRV